MANQTFTRDELRKYNGQNGAAAYIAIDGIVPVPGCWKSKA